MRAVSLLRFCLQKEGRPFGFWLEPLLCTWLVDVFVFAFLAEVAVIQITWGFSCISNTSHKHPSRVWGTPFHLSE